MSAHRLILYLYHYKNIAEVHLYEIIQAFFMGLRFDLLVLGFLLIPLVFAEYIFDILIMVFKKSGLPRTAYFKFKFSLMYVFLISIIVFYFGLNDFIYFQALGERFSYELGPPLIDPLSSLTFTALASLMFLVIFALALFHFLRLSYIRIQAKDQMTDNISGPWLAKRYLAYFIPFFVVGFMARGTLRAHHLRNEDRVVSQSRALNLLVPSPIWCLDKKLD